MKGGIQMTKEQFVRYKGGAEGQFISATVIGTTERGAGIGRKQSCGIWGSSSVNDGVGSSHWLRSEVNEAGQHGE